MALTYSKPIGMGTEAPNFKLRGVDDRFHSLSDFRESKALVVVFMCNHCPYVIAIQGRLNHLAKEYQARGVQFIGINSNDPVRYPDDSFEEMKVRAKEQGFVFPYLQDDTQEVARAYGAVCTPEFYAFGPAAAVDGSRSLQYQGRLDDSWKNEAGVTRRELALALDAILAGKPPVADQKPAMGCSIKWK